jgi:hypothetical protein
LRRGRRRRRRRGRRCSPRLRRLLYASYRGLGQEEMIRIDTSTSKVERKRERPMGESERRMDGERDETEASERASNI